MTTVHDTEVDGVRCFWVDSGRPTLAASLIFRQGMCDEPLIESGWLHMLEHLALHGRGGGSLSINGSVSPLYTTFDAHGPAEAVARHFTDVASWLAEPQLDNFEHESGVLRAEARGRGTGGPVGNAMAWRFGARGPGVVSQQEPGMGRATVEALTERARRVFTSGNAVVVFDGPPPQDLRLRLHDGDLLRPRDAVPCDDELPAAYVAEAGVVLSGLVERSTRATVVPMVLHRILKDRLRDSAGAAYAPWADYQAVDDRRALVLAGSDVNPELNPTIVKTMLDIVDRVKEGGLPGEYVAEAVELMVQSCADPYNAFGLAHRSAYAVTNGREPETLDEVLAGMHAVTADSLDESAREFATSLLLGVPGKSTWHDELPMLKAPSEDIRGEGRRFRHRDWPATALQLYVGKSGVQVSDRDTYRSAATSDIDVLFTYPDGARRALTGDGWGVFIEPDEWTKGRDAASLIDQLVPQDQQLLQPARSDVNTGSRMSFLRRWWKGLRRTLGSARLRWVWIGLYVALIGVGLAAHNYLPAVVGTIWVIRFASARRKVNSAASTPT